ncbi:MAG: hypothetical protein EHM34_04105 [Nitrosopumilales archaeon]|nr:MAG: hypothetical protein EHM34_04105 [Nitrosopumilales archaeon]
MITPEILTKIANLSISEKRCELCESVDRGVNGVHNEHWITERCPFFDLTRLYPSLEWCILYTGCCHFKKDVEYEHQCEEKERYIQSMTTKNPEN